MKKLNERFLVFIAILIVAAIFVLMAFAMSTIPLPDRYKHHIMVGNNGYYCNDYYYFEGVLVLEDCYNDLDEVVIQYPANIVITTMNVE